MTSMLMELYDALVNAGATETKARAAASAVPHGKDLCTRQDFDRGMAELRTDIKVLKFAVFSMYPFILALVIKMFFFT